MDEVQLGSRTLQPHRQLLASGRREPIGKRALDILSVLAEARGQIVTKHELLERVWPGVVVEENALQVHVVALRKALGPEADRLKTIRGVGYQLDIDGEPAAAEPETAAAPLAKGPPPPARAPAALRAVSGTLIWDKLHPFRWAMAVAALLLMVGGTWVVFGGELGLRSRERIPVVVRALAVSGSGDSTEAALANGITDELIVRLRRIADLRVATAEADGSVPGGSFNGAYVVDGSIRRIGDRLRVTARVSDSAGEILWSQSFDRRLVDLLEVQERIAASIADTLSVSFDVGTNSTEFGGTDNPEAFAAYMQYRTTPLSGDGLSTQMRHLERAIALDPNYISAINQLSVLYSIETNYAETKAEALASLAKADRITARAIAANPDLWIGYMARGYYFANRHDFAAANRSFERVAELDKGVDPDLRGALAGWALNMGRTREALELHDSRTAIDPMAQDEGAIIWALSNAGRHDEAIRQFNEMYAEDGLARSASNVFASYLALGREAEAIRFADKHLPGVSDALRGFKANRSLHAMSLAQLRQWAAKRYGEGGYLDLVQTAHFASYSGQGELAVNLLRVAFERYGGYGFTSMWFPVMASARQTDAFERFVADLGLLKMWRETGRWPDYCRPVDASEITCS